MKSLVRLPARLRGAAMLIAVVTLSACAPGDLFDPDVPRSAEVDHAATSAVHLVDGQLAAMVPGQGPLLPSRRDECRGSTDHSRDIYQWMCTYSAGVLAAGGGVFEAAVRRQDRLVRAAGCESEFNESQQRIEDADWLITRYWRTRDPGRRSAKNMPDLHYLCGEMKAMIEFTDPTDKLESVHGYGSSCGITSSEREVQRLCQQPSKAEVSALLAGRTDQVLMYLWVSEVYHQEPW